jgi:ketosteroid isomerase-like protein
MSQENVDLLRRNFAAFNEGDLDGAASIFRADAEWVPYLGGLAGEVHRGPDEIIRMWLDLNEHLSHFQNEPKEFIDCGERIVVVVEAVGKGTESGAEVRHRWAQVWSFRDGLVARVEPFPTRTQALEAVGLSE